MKVRIGLGTATHPFSDARAFWRWVDLCEGSEIDSLWQTDRLSSSQPFLEAMSTMAALAGATSRLKFGMNAVVVSQRDPLVLAKQCATIDYLSGGRLLPVFGVGGGEAPEWQRVQLSVRIGCTIVANSMQEAAGMVTHCSATLASRFPAASRARTVQQYSCPGASPSRLKQVAPAAVVALGGPAKSWPPVTVASKMS